VVFSCVDAAAVDDLPNVELVSEEVREGADAESYAADRSAVCAESSFGANALAIEVLNQEADLPWPSLSARHPGMAIKRSLLS
jgi:hypothetical protein